MLTKNERYVIQKGRCFLMGLPYDDSAFCRYTNSPYDGWQSKSFNTSIRVAKQIGAKVVVFNRLTGDLSGGWK